jgi:hypothetical protein
LSYQGARAKIKLLAGRQKLVHGIQIIITVYQKSLFQIICIDQGFIANLLNAMQDFLEIFQALVCLVCINMGKVDWEIVS